MEFKENLKDFIVFDLQDMRKIEAQFDLRRLSEWQDKGYIKMIRKGYYIFSDVDINESVLFFMANKMYSPSYVSMEMALSFYHLIPEAVYAITSVTSQKTNVFHTELGEFIYQHIKPALMFGYKLISYQNHSFAIAEIEKTILDYFYLNPHLKTQNDFSSVRFNDEEFKNNVDMGKFNRYLDGFINRSLEQRVKNFLRYIQYA